ncbi:MAG: hypothetical protein HY736_26855 [Verrucomicrobia bacterium]|nr:hypothetical protein [Verrucomicrobiota bacterium]
MISLLRQALSRHPFYPVTLVMVDGEKLVIENENFAAVLAKAGLLYVEKPDQEEPLFLNLLLVREVRTKGLTPEFKD